MISFAQNYEDVILYRALKHIKKGCYLDIGAWDPVLDSVSMFFYQDGWRGVHVEPTPDFAEKLRQARPEEYVIEAAVCEKDEKIILHKIGMTGLTTFSKKYQQAYIKNGFVTSDIEVKTIRLESILKQVKKPDIHWMKIDVEGMEEEVLRSWGQNTVRPWVVVVESTVPSTDIETNAGEDELRKRDYSLVYFDKLNKFYLHNSHSELAHHFKHGPNIFDKFIRADHWQLQQQSAMLDKDLKDRTSELILLREYLIGRDKDLGNTREVLKERTGLLEQASKSLKERTQELIGVRELLQTRTSLLEDAGKSLKERTEELVEVRGLLEKKTSLLEDAGKILKERTQELVEVRGLLETRTSLLEVMTKTLKEKTEQLEKSLNSLIDKEKEYQSLKNRLHETESKLEEEIRHTRFVQLQQKETLNSLIKLLKTVKIGFNVNEKLLFISNPFLFKLYQGTFRKPLQHLEEILKHAKDSLHK